MKRQRVLPASPVKPMLAKETTAPFDDEDWLFEIKWDGFRAVAEITPKTISLYSRNGNDFSQRYLPVTNALAEMPFNAILDGEIVALNESGMPDFQKIQLFGEAPATPLCYYIFDILSLNGKSTSGLSLIERKEILKNALPENDVVRYSDHIIDKGISFYKAAEEKNMEGIMAKRAASKYYEGSRTTDWLKIKTHKTADVIICGYTEPTGSRKWFGSLVLGIMKAGKLVNVGHAGSGYNQKSLKEIYDVLQKHVQPDSPFSEKISVNNKVTWLKPEVVCEVKFAEWTADEKLRHPVFLRIRNDKKINQTTMEAQAPVVKKPKKNVDEKAVKKTVKKNAAQASEKPAKTPSKSVNNIEENTDKKGKKILTVKDGKNEVLITNPDKIYFPDDKVTKKMVVEYYQSVAEYILPFLKDRPQSLKRNPNGIDDNGFFHKDAGDKAPGFVKTTSVHSDSTDKEIEYIICNNKATLAYMNNLGCIEINPWHSTVNTPDKPDYMIIDIDPSDNNTFDEVVETANAYKEVLDKASAQSFCKTSGSTGLHIYVPMKKKYDYEEVKNFAEVLSVLVNEMLPDFTTMERNLKKRGKDKIYLDHLQNRRSQTISSVYSLRPKKGATVSMPLEWSEVKKGLSPQQFNIFNALKRIGKKHEMFVGIMGSATNIPSCLKKLGV